MISTDGNATLLTLYLEDSVSLTGMVSDAQLAEGKELGQWSFERYIYLQIEEALRDFSEDFDQVFQVGVSAMQVEMKKFIIEDQRYLLSTFSAADNYHHRTGIAECSRGDCSHL